ncbi:unnamed protein product [Cuscuta epithymum]|uniref:Thioredoxin domain-containing protein n=1 Tax=Cuscuta epithymum TaxID=186058 RepID=A0AAV0E1X9_9ASTE|nr:unnamed protein product [Cuscuta epithymum]CAH9127472.1 unnamed protein product [Cuscuta epithymum]
MAEVVSKVAGVAFSPSSTCFRSAARRYSQRVVCSFPVGPAALSRAGSDVQSLKLRCGALNSPNTDFDGRAVDIATKVSQGNGRKQMSTGIGKAQRWWEKGLQPNMKEVAGAQDLVDSLKVAADKLVVVDFFSPGCGGCKALHPKICQFAEMNPDIQFLQVNYEEHKSMCYSLNVHVLPFFRFYRGSEGRVCSFSCTNATIKKFKDAIAKHGTHSGSGNVGPAKGLEEKELLALAANRDLSFNYTPKSEEQAQPLSAPSVAVVSEFQFPSSPLINQLSKGTEDRSFISSSGR